MHDKELQDLVESSIPSSPYSLLQQELIGTSSVGLVFDHPIFTAKLIPYFQAPSNLGTRFQFTFLKPRVIQATVPQTYSTVPTYEPPVTTIPNVRLDISSSDLNENIVTEKLSRNKTVKNIKKDKNVRDAKIERMVTTVENTTSSDGLQQCNSNGNRQPKKKNNNNNASIQHLQSNRFVCSLCSRSFRSRRLLQSHKRIHTTERPYFCKICEQQFKRNHHLNTHMKLHTGERPYVCCHCSKGFIQKANLLRHLKVHEPENLYICPTCSSRFSNSTKLKFHLHFHKKDISTTSFSQKRKQNIRFELPATVTTVDTTGYPSS